MAAENIFSTDVEDEFILCEKDYRGPDPDQTRQILEVDSGSDELEEPDNLEQAQPATGSADFTSQDTVEKATQEEDKKIDTFIYKSCGCQLGLKNTPCSGLFTKEQLLDQRLVCLALEKSELDMVVLAQLQAFSNDTEADAEQESAHRRNYIAFMFKGRRICRKTFLFLHALSLKRYRNLLVHYNNNGLVAREHGNTSKSPHNRIAFTDVQDIVAFIERLAEIHALPLPGRMPNHKDKALLLPSDISKSEVYRQYTEACILKSTQPVSWAKFHCLWSELLPHIDTMKPSSDLCFECQQNATRILQCANLTEDEKADRLKVAELHLCSARNQRSHYNEQCKAAKAEWEIFKSTPSSHAYGGVMHYSFDYAQNVQYPSNPQQPGPAYFKSARKCGIFGIACEPLTMQVNYLIDEADDPGKGANATVSMLHHFLENHSVGETHLQLHADNCVAQNKNNILMQYLMWRTMTGKNESVQISFMVVGHTKFAPDRFFGLIKKKYRYTFVSTLDEMQEVVRKSMICGQNISQLTKDADGRKLVNWYDWKSYLCTLYKTIPNITTYHHFRFDKKSKGIAFVRTLVDSPELAVTISSGNAIDIHKLPPEIVPKGLDLKRQWYLHEEIAPFCSSEETASITCPRPAQPKSNSDPMAIGSTQEHAVVKRKRACSHCHQEGHTKTKRGKITCPQLL